MLDKIRQRLTYANVMATLAVFIALGGSSYAALTISGSDIKNRSIAGKKLKRNTLTGKEIRESRLARVPTGAQRRPAQRRHRRQPEGPLPHRHVPVGGRLRGAHTRARRPRTGRLYSSARGWGRRPGRAVGFPRTGS